MVVLMAVCVVVFVVVVVVVVVVSAAAAITTALRSRLCETFSVTLKEEYRFAEKTEKFLSSRLDRLWDHPSSHPTDAGVYFLEHKAARA
jgi:hypothetical protein